MGVARIRRPGYGTEGTGVGGQQSLKANEYELEALAMTRGHGIRLMTSQVRLRHIYLPLWKLCSRQVWDRSVGILQTRLRLVENSCETCEKKVWVRAWHRKGMNAIASVFGL